MKNNVNPIVSVGIIVKNQEEKIEKCLKALEPLKDAISCEVIVADTGSTDKTKQIAEKYADMVFDFEWIDDFSAARNAVMDRCSGEWYFSIDSDEYLDSNINELVKFLNGDFCADATSAYVKIKNYSDKDDYSQYVEFYASRLVRMSTGTRFFGAIHERFDDRCSKNIVFLQNTVFWHDGYLKNDSENSNVKNKRNIALLEKLIEEDPDDIWRNFQAMESSYNRELECKYARKIVELVNKKVENSERLAAASYRHAVRVAMNYDLPEYDLWLNESLNKYQDSIFTQVDVRFYALSRCMTQKKYDMVIEHGKCYLDGIKNIGKNENQFQLHISVLTSASKLHRENVIISMAYAYAHLLKFNKSEEYLRKVKMPELSLGSISNWINVAYYVHEKIDISDLFTEIKRIFIDINDDDLDDFTKKKKEILMKISKEKFIDEINQQENKKNMQDDDNQEYMPENPPYDLISLLGDCDLAYSASIMMTNDRTEIELLSTKIKEWDSVPIAVYIHIMNKCVTFPAKFYNQSVNSIQDKASYVVSLLNKNFVCVGMRWLFGTDEVAYPLDKNWRYAIMLGCMRLVKWKEENSLYQYNDLLKMYINYSDKFLNWYYNQNILCEDMIIVLPEMHRFAWLLVNYKFEKDNGNNLEAIKWLRKALDVAPIMKYLINHLLKEIECDNLKLLDEKESIELYNLANKVKTILSNYPQDDPIVKEIKLSDAYKKVEYLIESPSVRFKM